MPSLLLVLSQLSEVVVVHNMFQYGKTLDADVVVDYGDDVVVVSRYW